MVPHRCIGFGCAFCLALYLELQYLYGADVEQPPSAAIATATTPVSGVTTSTVLQGEDAPFYFVTDAITDEEHKAVILPVKGGVGMKKDER
jgi:hypothetical protein